jgi:predicted RNA-binding protein with PUA-like domain
MQLAREKARREKERIRSGERGHNERMPFLFKEEPDNYSFDAFAADGRTTWEGVKNPVAQRHLSSVRKGDLVFYYHTGKEKAIVGVAKAAGDAYPDPKDKSGRAHVVDLVPVKN